LPENGFFEGPKKEIDWHMVDDEHHPPPVRTTPASRLLTAAEEAPSPPPSAPVQLGKEEPMRKIPVAVAVLACAVLAPAAWAGGQQVVVEAARDGRSLVVRTYRCGTPASLSLAGEAEGLVGGQRRTIALEIKRAHEPGAFNVARQWPAEGQWALVFTVVGEHPVSTLVTLEPGAGVRIAAQKQGYEKPTAETIVTALASAPSPR
jgi:hypothetical protein